jgi:hypothetical protein
MLREIAGGLVGLGLIGGVGAVTYDGDGTANVTITDPKTGKTESVTIAGDGSRSFSCPDGTDAKLEPIDIRAGRIKITLRRVEKRLDGIDRKHPGGQAPDRVADRYNQLAKRGRRLVNAYNAEIDKHNAVIDSDCEPE